MLTFSCDGHKPQLFLVTKVANISPTTTCKRRMFQSVAEGAVNLSEKAAVNRLTEVLYDKWHNQQPRKRFSDVHLIKALQ